MLCRCWYGHIQITAEEEQRFADVHPPLSLSTPGEGGIRHGGGQRLLLPPCLGAQQPAPLFACPDRVRCVEGCEPSGETLINDLVEGGTGMLARSRRRIRAPTASTVQVPGQVPQCGGDLLRLLHGVVHNGEQSRVLGVE